MQLLLEALRPSSVVVLAMPLLLAHILDYVYPKHTGLLLRIHPVHTAYVLAKRIAKPYSSKARGVLAWVIVVGLHLLVYALLLILAWLVDIYLWIAIATYITKTSMSLRLLIKTVQEAGYAAGSGDWATTRRLVQEIVRRNVYRISERHVLSAAIESLSENIVDGYTSPLFYYILLGPLGALFQRLVSTLDAALGYRTPEYINVGWFSARMDDLVNYIPARLTALTILLLAPLNGQSIRKAVSIWRRYHGSTLSINAGHPLAAMAAVLNVKLEKPNYYTIAAEFELPLAGHVLASVKVVRYVAAVWLVSSIIVLWLLEAVLF